MGAIQIQLDPSVAGKLRGMVRVPEHILLEMKKEIDLQNELTVGHIQATRMSGRGPFPVEEGRLGVRTGRLRQSLRPSKATIAGGKTIVSAIGTNVIYMGPHEFGFTGLVNVRAHARRGKKGVHQVKAHARQANVPSRAPIRQGIEDRAPAYGRAISEAFVRGWDKGGKQSA